jgi:hypothetical protein
VPHAPASRGFHAARFKPGLVVLAVPTMNSPF